MEIGLVGATIKNPKLTSLIGKKQYDIGKVYVWFNLLQRGQRPTKWGKPTKTGTRIEVEFVREQLKFEAAKDELEMYMRQVNREHGTELEFNRGEETEE